MDKLRYEKPTMQRKQDAMSYIEEFLQYKSPINGVGGLDRYLWSYSSWLQKLDRDRVRPVDETWVPGETYFLVRENDNRIVGMCNIRLASNEKVLNDFGHIGYSIRPTERRKGYNKVNLYLALKVCEEHGLKTVNLGCYEENEASARTMLALGATLIRKFQNSEGRKERMYQINVKDSLSKYGPIYEQQTIQEKGRELDE